MSVAMAQKQKKAKSCAKEKLFRYIADFSVALRSSANQRAYVYVSPNCRQVTGYTAEEFCNSASLEQLIAPEDIERWRRHLELMQQKSMENCSPYAILPLMSLICRSSPKMAKTLAASHLCTCTGYP